MICKSKSCAREIDDGYLFCPYCGRKQQQERKHKKRANGTGTICKLSGHRAKPYLARKNDIPIGTYKTYVEAQRALDKLSEQDVTEKFNLSFAQIYDKWKPEHFREISDPQKGNYEFAYNHAAALHSKKFRTLRKSDYMAVVMQMENDGYAKSSVEKVLQLFGQLSQWALDEGIIPRIYATNIKTVATQKKTKIPFTPEELAAIQKCTMPGADLLRIMIATGCRPKDLFTAELQNCHGDYFISGSKTEAGYDRAIAVSDYGLADYQSLVLMATIKGAKKLIEGHDGDHIYENWRKREYAEIKASLSLGDKTPYNARHTYATAAFASGMSQELLARQMGHEDIRTTDRIYNHTDDQRTIAAGRNVKIAVSNKL